MTQLVPLVSVEAIDRRSALAVGATGHRPGQELVWVVIANADCAIMAEPISKRRRG